MTPDSEPSPSCCFSLLVCVPVCICALILLVVSFYTGDLCFCVEGLDLIYCCNAWNIIDSQIFVGQMKINPLTICWWWWSFILGISFKGIPKGLINNYPLVLIRYNKLICINFSENSVEVITALKRNEKELVFLNEQIWVVENVYYRQWFELQIHMNQNICCGSRNNLMEFGFWSFSKWIDRFVHCLKNFLDAFWFAFRRHVKRETQTKKADVKKLSLLKIWVVWIISSSKSAKSLLFSVFFSLFLPSGPSLDWLRLVYQLMLIF